MPGAKLPPNPALSREESVSVPPARLARLRLFNAAMGVLHAASGAAMIALGNAKTLPVTTFNLNGPPGTAVADGVVREAFGVPLAPATAAFLFLSAAFHALIATVAFRKYGDELRNGRNRLRWLEYALSSSLMIVLVCLVTGVTDLAALIGAAFVNASMILFGWIMEMVNDGRSATWWTPFYFGCVAGAGPWVAIAAYLAVNVSQAGSTGPPGFVYGIIFSIFFFFNIFALNQWLQYKRVWKWADYLFGETVYIILSLVAKSILAWQIFANVLIDT